MFRFRVFIFIIVIMVSLSSTAWSQSFSQSDLAGNWYVYSVASGDNGVGTEDPRWERINIEIDASGDSINGTVVDSGGGADVIGAGDVTLNLSSSGIMTSPSFPEEHGILNEDTNLFAYTHTDDGYHLKVGIKRERVSGTSPFQVSELEGDWRGCQIVSGDNGVGSEDPRCGYGEVTINASGVITNGTWNSFSSSGTTDVTTVSGVTFSVTVDGILGTDNPTNHGVLSDDANTLTFVETDDGYSLFFMMRDSGVATFDVTDLQGRWTAHSVVTGDRPDITPAWSHATIVFDSSGNFTVSSTEPSGTATDSGTVDLSNRGLITVSGENIFGYLSDDGDVLIIMTDLGGDGNEVIIGIRGGPDTSSGGGGTGGGGGGGCFISSVIR